MCCKPVVNHWPIFLHETMNSACYVNDILNAFFNQLIRVIRSLAMDKLKKVSHNLFMRGEACLQAEGGHFQHLL
jgi:hypothetical protein